MRSGTFVNLLQSLGARRLDAAHRLAMPSTLLDTSRDAHQPVNLVEHSDFAQTSDLSQTLSSRKA